jgi:hypothetical protein
MAEKAGSAKHGDSALVHGRRGSESPDRLGAVSALRFTSLTEFLKKASDATVSTPTTSFSLMPAIVLPRGKVGGMRFRVGGIQQPNNHRAMCRKSTRAPLRNGLGTRRFLEEYLEENPDSGQGAMTERGK